MGLKLPVAIAAGALLVALAEPADAARRGKTRFDGIRDCERTAASQFLRHNAAFRRFAIDRADVSVDKYADRVGTMFVSTVYHGRATYEAGNVSHSTRFICLHSGMGRRAIFVYTLPE